jgi:hypothetical protein
MATVKSSSRIRETFAKRRRVTQTESGIQLCLREAVRDPSTSFAASLVAVASSGLLVRSSAHFAQVGSDGLALLSCVAEERRKRYSISHSRSTPADRVSSQVNGLQPSGVEPVRRSL